MFVRIILSILIISLFTTSCSSNRKMVFSKRYTPVYNPGGDSFYSNRDFVKSYSMYEKRRNAIISKSAGNNQITEKEQSVSEKEIIDKLNEYGIISSSSDKKNYESNSVKQNNSKSMVNGRGIDLSLLKGAKYIDVDDKNWGPIRDIHGQQKKSLFSKIFENLKRGSHSSKEDHNDDGYVYYLHTDNIVDGEPNNLNGVNKSNVNRKKAVSKLVKNKPRVIQNDNHYQKKSNLVNDSNYSSDFETDYLEER